jgi:tRNA pseudouridine38-40 synthase
LTPILIFHCDFSFFNLTFEFMSSARRNIKLTISYDGSNYHGWQRQINGITVQQVLELAMARVVNHPVKLCGSGRTDSFVHAAGQVANAFIDTPIPDDHLHKAVNTRLPDDIRILSARTVPDDFDAISSAKSKLYRYAVFNHHDLPPAMKNYCWNYWQPCQLEPMRRAADLLLGTHDFASFAGAGSVRKTTIRTLTRCQVQRKYHWLYFDFEADGFLYHMVRNIVGTLIEVGRGHWPVEKMTEILAARDRSAAGRMAPAQGLTLQWVKY